MKLILKNIGMLKAAEITLHPLCVIAGENDNGKSTVGKVIFCIIKAINRYKEDLQESKENKIEELLDQLFFTLRRGIEDHKDVDHGELSSWFTLIMGKLPIDNKLTEIKTRLNTLRLNTQSREELENQLEDIKKLAHAPENTRLSIERAFIKVFAAEFDSSILLDGSEEGSIQLYENELLLIDLKIEKGNKVHLLSEVAPIEIKDATFIESPLILNNHDLLIRSRTPFEQERSRLGLPYTTLHTKDLFDKLREPSLAALLDTEPSEGLSKRLHSLINGEIVYDRSTRDFVFKRKNTSISIKNTASGIKTFGLLQILLANEMVNKNTILIFDEPENHLHPKWQLKLAKILVELANHGVFILVSSHSPYMIEALERYAELQDMKKQSAFFLAEKRKIDDHNRLEDIFKLLSEPFEIFRQMDAEALRDE